jgi:hypothetical protein
MVFHASRKAPWRDLPGWAKDLEMPSKRVQSDFAGFLAITSLGVGLVMFRRRPVGRRSLPMPGVAAAAAAFSVLLFKAARTLPLISYRGLWSQQSIAGWVELLHGPEYQASTTGTAVAGAILGTWSYLALARAWRARDDWRDWLGRWLGWAWLSQIAFHPLFLIIWG